jgi:CHAT domain-containing protein
MAFTLSKHCKRGVGMNLRYALHAIGFLSRTLALLISISPYSVSAATDAEQHFDSGVRNFNTGNFALALEEWRTALDLFEEADDFAGQIRALQRLGETRLAMGQQPRALAELNRARALAEQFGNRSLLASISVSIAAAYSLDGDTRHAERFLRAAIELSEQSGERNVAATARNNLGNLLATQRRHPEALAMYRKALEQARAAGDRGLATKVTINMARTHVDRGDLQRAQQTLKPVLFTTRQLSASHEKAYALISIGRLYVRVADAGSNVADNRRQAYTAFNDASAAAEINADKRALSYALGYTGALYESLGQFEDAFQATQRAVHQAQLINAPELLFRWEWQTGRLLRRQGDRTSAIAAYERARYALQPIRRELATRASAGGTSFREEVGALFLELAGLQLDHALTLDDRVASERYLRGVRETIEALKGAELENYFQDDCVAALQEKTRGIDRLGSNTAAVYPIILPDRLAILLSLPDGIKLYTTEVDADTLNRTLNEFRHLLEKRTTNQYLQHAKTVHDWLISPIQSDLSAQNILTLVFVPDGMLRTIPLAALYDGQRFLVENYAVATVPGLTLTDPRPIERKRINVLANGLTEAVQGFPPLPEVGQELDAIEGLYGGKVLNNAEFQTGNFEAELSDTPYSIVHIASHGQFSSDVGKTFVLTYDGRITMDALEQYMARTQYRESAVELITLSACQTATGDDRAALGLAGIAIKAGARSALATLWYISDQASSELVAEFYRQLQDPALSKAKALQRAQLTLLTDIRYRHPGYWAPFLLIGNWL